MRRRSLLPWIVFFKAVKALTLTLLGIGVLATRHVDLPDLLIRLALTAHLPVTSELLDRALRFVTDLAVGRQTALALTAFGYAALMGTEGVGLYMRKTWARWFTIIATGSLIPFELYEIVREVHLLRVVILLLNLVVVVYLHKRKEVFEA